MKRVLFYFTGSGNSLIIAKKLAQELGDCELRSVAQQVRRGEKVSADEIGFVFPVYMHRTPKIVLRMLPLIEQCAYAFAVATNGGQMGVVLSQFHKELRKQQITLNAGFALRMPDNYTPFGGPPEEEKQREMFAACDEKLKDIVNLIKNRGTHMDNETSFFKKHLWPGLFYTLGYSMIPKLDSSFYPDSKCNGCGVCAKVCPVGNISIIDGMPKWGGNCEQCFACLHWCPSESVEYGKKSVGEGRYRHPEATIQDLYEQAGN